MEEIDEGRVKSAATVSGSTSAKANNNQYLASNDNKEEGELSDFDEDENPVSSGPQSTGTITPSAGTLFTTAMNTTEGTSIAKTAVGNNIASSVDIQSRSSVQPNNQKSFEKNRVTFSGNPGWFPNSTNSNLVISFSDDDSGSESEDSMHEKPSEVKSNAAVVKNSGRPPASSLIKSNQLRETARNVNKIMPKKLTSHRTFISSRSKARGGANSRSSGTFAVEQGSRVRNFNTLNKNLGSQERDSDQEVGWKNSQLHDLRQQIALRESELKLKAAQQNKDVAVVSCSDYNAVNLSNDVTRNYQSTSALVGQSELKEPDSKRLKVDGSYTHQATSDGQREIAAVKSVMPTKEPTLENNSLRFRNMVDCGQKNIPISRVDSSIAKPHKQDGKQIDVTSEHTPNAVKDAADISSSCSQFERDSRRVDPCVNFSQSAPQSNMTSSASLKNLDRLASNHPRKVGEHHPSGSVVNKISRNHNEMNSIGYREAICGDKTAEPSFNNLCQVNNTNMWNCLSDVNVSGHSNMDIQSIIDMEELLDKELEQAQEHRLMREIEERNALKAYRNAQRALFEANARCSKLYRQRELCSARFRSFIMEDSNLLWPSRPHESVGNQLDLSNHISENMNLIAMSSHQMQPSYDTFNRQGYDSSFQCVNDAPITAPYQHANRQNLGSEPCSEPDASTSEPLPHKSKDALNRLSSQSNELNASADEDEETFPLLHESDQPNCEYQQSKQISDGRQKGTNTESIKKLSIDSSQDPLLLEATLRSELFARLGKRTLSTNSDSYNVEHPIDRGPDTDFGSDKMQMSNGSVPSSEGGQNQQHDTGGTDKPERSIHETFIQIQVQDQYLSEDSSSKFHFTADPKENEFPFGVNCSTSELLSPPLVLRSAFDHLKVGSSITVSDQPENEQNQKCTLYVEEYARVNSNETLDGCLIANSEEETAMVYFGNKIGSYTCNLALDPFWPICMYELRGKCNNDECPWQHVNNISNENVFQHRHDDSDSSGGLTIPQQNCDSATKLSKFQNILTPPMYITSLDMLKAGSHSNESVVARTRRHGQCWQKSFSMSLALSSMFQKDLPTELLHPSDGRIEVHGGWSGQSSYFQSRNGVMNQLKQALLDKVQSVEMALLIVNQEASKVEGVKKALSVLSRALEADRTSESLWIIYLLIYYGSRKSVGKDDMFSYADEKVWTRSSISAEVEHVDLEPGDFLTSFDYLMEKEALIVGTSTGLLQLHSVDGNAMEVVGRVDGGVRCISASPDGDLLGIVTGFGQILVMTHDWDLLYENALEDLPEGVDVREPDLSSTYIFESPISWRGDGKYFATLSQLNSSASSQKKLKVWERDSGALQASSEPKVFMGAVLEWMPSGAKIAAVYDRKSENKCPSIVFFERNGLERSSFSINEKVDATIELLKWNCSSDLLAAVVRCDSYDSVKIWVFSNNHWYLKHEIRYSRQDGVRFMWHPTKPLQLICWTLNGQITNYNFIWTSAVLENSTALVIDGSKILVTPLSLSLMPPPMYLFSLNFPSAVRDMTFFSKNSRNCLAASLSDGCLCVVELPVPDMWEELDGKEFIVDPSISETTFGSFVHLIWLDSHVLLCVSHYGLRHSNHLPRPSSSKDGLVGFYLQEIELVCSEDHVPGLVTCSGWHAKITNQNPLEGLLIGMASNPAKKCSAFLQFEGGKIIEYMSKLGMARGSSKNDDISFSSSCPWMSVVSVAINGPLKPSLFGLDDVGRLHVSGKIVCNNCSSFSFYSKLADQVISHLILATKQDLLFIVDVNDILCGKSELKYENFIHAGNKRREEENMNFVNIWERGAKVIGVLHGDEAAVVLQTNRGNLECIYPRKLVLSSIVNALVQGRFSDALLMVRRHRIDFNVIVDHCGWQAFLQSASEFVQQVNNLSYITDFVCAIKNENITKTLYRNFEFLSLPSQKEVKDVQVNDFKGSDANKVFSVLLAIRKSLEEHVPESPARELCILTTLARSDPPALEEALERIKVIRETELSGSDNPRRMSYPSAEEALKHLLWLSDSEAVYEAALGLYDLNLAAIVALNSQRDPKEFLPFLQELEHMPAPLMRYNIDLRLQRFENALKHLASMGDALYADCMDLMKKYPQLFPLGLQLITDPAKRGQVLEAWADHLSDEKCFEDAATTYLCCFSLEKAMKAYRACGNWSGVLTVAGLLKLGKHEVMQLAHELYEELQALGKPGEAAKIALDYCGDVNNGISSLLCARDWEEALRVAFLHRREDLISEVKNAALECASILIGEYKEGLEKVGKYLTRYLAVRQRRVLLAAKLQAEDRSVNDLDDDTASEASSTFSGMSAYTTGTRRGSAASTTTSASKAREARRQRSRGKIRPGSPGEEMALVDHLKGMSVAAGAKNELKSLLVSLVMLGEEEIARKLQCAGENFQRSQMAAVKLAEDTICSDIIHEQTHNLEHYIKIMRSELQTSEAFSWQPKVFLSP